MPETTTEAAAPAAEAPVEGGIEIQTGIPELSPDERAEALKAWGIKEDAPSAETKPATEEPTKAAEEAPKAEEPEDDEPKDDEAEVLARLVGEDRRLKVERRKLDAERKEHADALARLKAVEEAKSRGDRAAVLKALGYDDIEDFFVGLSESIHQPEQPLTRAEAEAIAERKYAERIAADKAREEAAAQERNSKTIAEASTAYADAVGKAFSAERDSFPLIAATGVSVERIDAVVRATYEKTGRVPAPREVLEHFEKRLAERGLTLRGKEPAPTVTGAWKDSGAVVAPPEAPKSLSERLADLKAMADRVIPR